MAILREQMTLKPKQMAKSAINQFGKVDTIDLRTIMEYKHDRCTMDLCSSSLQRDWLQGQHALSRPGNLWR